MLRVSDDLYLSLGYVRAVWLDRSQRYPRPAEEEEYCYDLFVQVADGGDYYLATYDSQAEARSALGDLARHVSLAGQGPVVIFDSRRRGNPAQFLGEEIAEAAPGPSL